MGDDVLDGIMFARPLSGRGSAIPQSGPDDDVRRWVLEHSEVVDRAWQRAGAVLPVSFNVIVAPAEESTAESTLERWLQDTSTALREKLSTLEGHVELRVEVAVEPLGLELAEIRDSQPGIEVRFLGPWPTYSLADLLPGAPGSSE